MQPRQYADLDLTIETDGDGYVARVVDSPAGQASHRFTLPFNAVALENFILKLGHSRSVSRRGRSSRLDIARSFGNQLYQTIFDDEVEVAFRTSLREALADGRGLRVRLRLDGVPDLAEVPWEYLYSEGLGRFLVMSSDTPLVRFLDVPTPSIPLMVEPPLRVLVMVSSPTDLDRLDVEREVELLRQGTADLTQAGALQLEVTPRADLHSLLRQLRQSEFHVFHFIGHGVFDPRESDGLLMLEDEDGHSRPVSGSDLGVILHDHHSLRLAVLNACEGARGSVEDPMGGVAQTLIRQGLPAAVAMQFEISDEAALVFAHEFYLAIADGYPIDAATVEARKAIFASGNDVEWGTPVLHLRATDGRVFDFTGESPTAQMPMGAMRDEATLASAERRFADAVAAWEGILARSPGDEAAALMLARARDGIEAAEVYAGTETLLATGRYQEALAALDRVGELDPEHGDPGGHRERANALVAEAEERRLVELEERKRAAADGEVTRARKAMDEGDLAEAQRRVEAVLTASPHHSEALGLRDAVGRRLRARQDMEEAATAFEGQRWEAVVAKVEHARTLDPTLADELALAAQASHHLASAPPSEAPPKRDTVPPGGLEDYGAGPPDRKAARWMTIGGGVVGVALLGLIVTNIIRGDETTLTTNGGTSPTITATTAITPSDLPAGTVGVFPVTGIEIDGVSTDWPNLEAIQSDRAVHPDPGSDPLVTARWLVGWDSETLYVLAEARDDSVDPGAFNRPSQLFLGDSVHFEVGADPEGAGSLRPDDLHVMLGPVDRSGSEVLAAINPVVDGNFSGGPSGADTGISATMRGDDTAYVVEAAIPWDVLKLDPQSGMDFGLNLNISDGDGSGGLEQMVSSNPERTIGNQPRPGTWNSARLLEGG